MYIHFMREVKGGLQMAPKAPEKKKKKKDGQLLIRIDKRDRDAFIELCDELDTSAAREIRRFIQEFLASSGKSEG